MPTTLMSHFAQFVKKGLLMPLSKVDMTKAEFRAAYEAGNGRIEGLGDHLVDWCFPQEVAGFRMMKALAKKEGLEGDALRGYLLAKRELVAKKAPVDVKKSQPDDRDRFDVDVPITKVDDEKRQAFGWAQIAKRKDGTIIIDKQDDFIDDISILEDAAYNFALNARDSSDMHVRKGVGKMIESMVFTPEKIAKLGLPAGSVPEGWWIGFEVHDDAVWKCVKDGTYKMFSVGGRGVRTEVEG